MSGTKSRARIGIEIGLAVILLIATFIWLEGLLGEKVGPGQEVESSGATYTGETAQVETAEIPVVLEAMGTVQPVKEAALSARIMGTVDRINVSEGDPVSADQVLVVLSAPEILAQSAAAGEAVTAAEATLAQARIDADRMESLFQKDAATRVEWEHARTALSVAEANLAHARESARAAAALGSFTEIRAPFGGVVVARNMDPGDLASPGLTILRIVDRERFRLEAAVEEREGDRMTVGTPVRASIDPLGMEAEARIGEVVPAADPLSRTILVKADLPKMAGLRAGQFGRLRVSTGTRSGLLVPERAVRLVGGLHLVTVVAPDGAASIRYVRVGEADRPGMVEVLSGLSASDRVAVGPPSDHE